MSVREAEVLGLLGEHLTHAEIAGRLFISVRTVESHVGSLRRKLRISERRGLIDLAVQHKAATVADSLHLALPAVNHQIIYPQIVRLVGLVSGYLQVSTVLYAFDIAAGQGRLVDVHFIEQLQLLPQAFFCKGNGV
ncbi:MAG: helix-turn-helix transcriptional regulator [Bacteroidetes bacterium]|nr:helix-turn-helix transcriptional regulator [Bacteroidota bacterium]